MGRRAIASLLLSVGCTVQAYDCAEAVRFADNVATVADWNEQDLQAAIACDAGEATCKVLRNWLRRELRGFEARLTTTPGTHQRIDEECGTDVVAARREARESISHILALLGEDEEDGGH